MDQGQQEAAKGRVGACDVDEFNTPGEKSHLSHLMGKRKLNLGCGCAPEPVWNGWLNIDINRRVCAGLVYDMRKPWPLRDASFNTIFSYLSLHMFFPGEEIFHVLAEAWRVLKSGGFFVAAVPEGFTGEPTQKSFWLESTPWQLCSSAYTLPELNTTGWDQGLPAKPWILTGIEKPDLLWFVLGKVE